MVAMALQAHKDNLNLDQFLPFLCVFGVQSCMSVWISYSAFSVLVYIILW